MQIPLMCTAAREAELAVGGLSDTLEVPTPFAAADVIAHDDSGRLSFHYAIVEADFAIPPALKAGQHHVPLWDLCLHCQNTSRPGNSVQVPDMKGRCWCKCRWLRSCKTLMQS